MDARDAARQDKGYEQDHKRMVIIVTVDDYDAEEEVKVEIPARYEVCPLCRGKGSHVNPSIDSHGLSREDFDADPGFKEDYFSGVYDVACYECGGRNVVLTMVTDKLTPEQERALKILRENAEDRAEMHAEMEAERRMGA
jgi:hypothetical protein